jgi:putative transposase
MVRNNKLSKHIQVASWNEFIEMISYKAEEAGKVVKKVDPRGIPDAQEMND